MAKKKSQRHQGERAAGQWTEAKFMQFLRSGLRQMHMRWPAKYAYQSWVRRDKPPGTVGKHKYEYQCAECGEWFPKKLIQIDHIVPCGSLKTFDDLPGFVERMFCEPSGYQCLCLVCHEKKTDEDRK